MCICPFRCIKHPSLVLLLRLGKQVFRPFLTVVVMILYFEKGKGKKVSEKEFYSNIHTHTPTTKN